MRFKILPVSSRLLKVEGICIARARDDGTLRNHWSSIIGVVASLKETMPVDCHGLISELVVHIDDDLIADIARYNGTSKFPIDGNYWSTSV